MKNFVSDPARWWVWLVLSFLIWTSEWVRAAERKPYVIHVTAGRVAASFGFEVLLIGLGVFRAGVLFAEHRRRSGRPNIFLGERPR